MYSPIPSSPCSTCSYLPSRTPSDSISPCSSLHLSSLSDISPLPSTNVKALHLPAVLDRTFAARQLSRKSDSTVESMFELPAQEVIQEDSLEQGMERLPPELLAQIFSNLSSDPKPSTRLKLIRLSRGVYTRIIPTIYSDVTLHKLNVDSYFHSLGASFNGDARPFAPDWPISGPGLVPLDQLGLSFDPSIEVSSFIRKFTLSNLARTLTISDFYSFQTILKAGSEAWVSGMNTWHNRVLFDQIDSLTLLPSIFEELDRNPLGTRGLLGEIWNCVKGDAVHLHCPKRVMKRETYEMALSAFGGPTSLGQRNRLLGEVVVHLPVGGLGGLNLWLIGASQVRINIYPFGEDDEASEVQFECGSSRNRQVEKALIEWLGRHFLPMSQGNAYTIPPELETIELYGVPALLLSPSSENRDTPVGASQHREPNETLAIIPPVILDAAGGDGQIAHQIAARVKLFNFDLEKLVEDERCTCCGM